MNLSKDVAISRFDFNAERVEEFQSIQFAKDSWPIVYILSDGTIKEAYVGETTDTYTRMISHLRNNGKNRLTAVHLISSEKFNKSATLDIESNLIKYISGDGQYKLMNLNIGLANHNYYQKKEVYWDIFKTIWNKLRTEGIAKHSIDHIDNSDLFKYSPYKSLSKDQTKGLLLIIDSLLNNNYKNIIVEGGAGTGKTILAIFLFKLLNSDNSDFNFQEFGDDEMNFVQKIMELKAKYPKPKMALVVPMSSFRNTLKKVFKNVKGLNSNMVVGPSEISKDTYDIIVVDESHRLRRRVNLGTYFGIFDSVCERLGFDKNASSELDWILKQSNKAIFFYDENQSIKPSDARKDAFDKLKASVTTKIEYLKSQFRVRGGNDYVSYINKLLSCELNKNQDIFKSKDYEFILFDDIEEMVNQIKNKDAEVGLSRLIAGYSWPWISKNDKSLYDIKIGGYSLQWNSVSDDFINSANALNEVGCIHTTQGYDLNYGGIIFGNEISYDKSKNEIVINKENYHDKNGKMSISDPAILKSFIINIYKTILLRSIKGTYVYVCDPNLRDYFSKHILEYEKETQAEAQISISPIHFEGGVPLYNLRAAAGKFSELQNPEDVAIGWVPLPKWYKTSKDLFACKVEGESMNKVIPNGSICLFRKYSGGTRSGKIVLVEHTSIQESELGSGYTVKEYHSVKSIDDDGWEHQSITLKPLSEDPKFQEIILSGGELNELKVIGVFECVL